MASGHLRTRIQAADVPGPNGPYSQAIVVHDMVYCAGQLAIDSATGQLIDGDVAAQTRRVLDNLGAVLHAAGTDLKHVVKTTVFLAHLGDFATMNEVYSTYFDAAAPPARSTVEVSALSRQALVEIECVAVIPPYEHPLHRRHQGPHEEEFDLESDSDI